MDRRSLDPIEEIFLPIIPSFQVWKLDHLSICDSNPRNLESVLRNVLTVQNLLPSFHQLMRCQLLLLSFAPPCSYTQITSCSSRNSPSYLLLIYTLDRLVLDTSLALQFTFAYLNFKQKNGDIDFEIRRREGFLFNNLQIFTVEFNYWCRPFSGRLPYKHSHNFKKLVRD